MKIGKYPAKGIVRQMSDCDNIMSAIILHCGGINEFSQMRIVTNRKKAI